MISFNIQKPDIAIATALQDKIDNLTKPKGSLGPFPDFPVDQLWDGREIEIHTTVDYLDFEAVLA